MFVNAKRHSWGVTSSYSSEASDSFNSESSDYTSEYSPLLPVRRRTTCSVEAEAEAKDVGYFQGLCLNYGLHFILCLVCYQHVMTGFVYTFCNMANPYIYKAYAVPAPIMQMFNSVTDLPWALKPVIGLISDVFPIFGYNKTPYILVTASIGTTCFFLVGLLPRPKLPLQLLVMFMFFTHLQIVTADCLLQGSFSTKVRTSLTRSRGLDLLTFAWSGIDAGGIAAVILAGIILISANAKKMYIIAAALAFLSIYPAARGYLDEKWVSVEATAKIRKWFWAQKEACFLSVLMFFMTILIPATVLVSQSAPISGTVSACILVLLLICSSLVLTPLIAMMNAYSIIQTAFTININAASFYFFTDTVEQFPEGPHFSNFFFNSVMGAVSCSGMLLGIYTYQRFSKGWTYRSWFLLANLIAALTNILYIFLYKRITFGIPVWLYTLISFGVNTMTERWKCMPLYCLMTYLCPRGMEATVFGCLMGSNNIATAISFQFGGCFLHFLGCRPAGLDNESTHFNRLWIAACWNSIVPMGFVLIFHRLVPAAQQNKSLLKRGASFTEGSLLRQFISWWYPESEYDKSPWPQPKPQVENMGYLSTQDTRRKPTPQVVGYSSEQDTRPQPEKQPSPYMSEPEPPGPSV